jgi:hypothetical protein
MPGLSAELTFLLSFQLQALPMTGFLAAVQRV